MPVPWREILLEELNEAGAIGVSMSVERHLGRTPTRSEITSARRAANRLADAGLAQAVLVSTPDAGRGGNAPRLVLAKPDFDTTDVEVLRAVATGRVAPPRTPRLGRMRNSSVLLGITRAMESAAAGAKRLDVANVDPQAAAEVAASLEGQLREVSRLRERLVRRARPTNNSQFLTHVGAPSR